MIIGANGANNDSRGALLGGNIWSDKAGRAKCAIAAAVLRGLHIVAHKGDLALKAAVRRSAQVINGREIDNLRIQARFTCTTAITQCGHGQLLRKWRGDYSSFCAAYPGGHLIFFNANIFEAQRP